MVKTKLGKTGGHIFREKDIFASRPLKKMSVQAKRKQTGKQRRTGMGNNNIIVPWYKKATRKTYWIDPSVAKRTSVYCALKGLKESPTVNRFLEEQLDRIGAPKIEG